MQPFLTHNLIYNILCRLVLTELCVSAELVNGLIIIIFKVL